MNHCNLNQHCCNISHHRGNIHNKPSSHNDTSSNDLVLVQIREELLCIKNLLQLNHGRTQHKEHPNTEMPPTANSQDDQMGIIGDRAHTEIHMTGDSINPVNLMDIPTIKIDDQASSLDESFASIETLIPDMPLQPALN